MSLRQEFGLNFTYLYSSTAPFIGTGDIEVNFTSLNGIMR